MADKYGNPPPSYGNPGMYPNLNQPQPGQPQPYPNQPYVPQTQPPQAQQHTIIINRAKFGPFPVRTECPLCKNEVLTETYSSAGLLAWLLGTGLCLVGCSLGCCLIPCCVDACRDVVHKCPSCKQQIALFKRL